MSTREPRSKINAPRGEPARKGRPGDQRAEHHKKDLHKSRDGRPSKPPGNQYWLYGTHAVVAALVNPLRKVRRLIASAETARALAPRFEEGRVLRPLPAEEVLDKIEIDRLLPPGAVHQGIAVLVEPLAGNAIEDVAEAGAQRERAMVLILDQVTDPRNVGAILRSAAAFGVLAVVVPDRHSPEEAGVLAKSASGALERIPLVRVTNVVRAIEILKNAGFWIAGMAGESPFTMAQQKLSGRIALVLGAEGEGLRRLTREHCDYLVKLPMTDAVESLNVSNAAAIAMYELIRED